MLSRFVSSEDRIELWSLCRKWGEQSDNSRKVYYSNVHNILSEDTMEIVMPTERSNLILLPVDSEYEVVIYGVTGLYQCFARIIDRYKSNNVYILVVELTSNLSKYQRRDFYRFSCALEMRARNLEEQEVQAKRSVIVDISGGGFRFMSDEKYEPDSLVCCTCQLCEGTERKEYEVVGKILAVNELKNRPGTYEHRVRYHNLDVETREKIIKFIFEEERKECKKDRLTKGGVIW